MAGTNAVGVVLFATLYAVAGARHLAHAAFLLCLLLLFGLVTALWVRMEARHRALEPLRRFGRVAGGLVIVIICTPALLLMPVFWLDTQLPAEAGLNALLAPIMALVLISLTLVVLVNLTGGIITVARALLGSRGTGAAS
jgi:hypothetical protein